MAGTITLDTPRLLLRRHVTEDAGTLYQKFGLDESMCRFSGWNPYATKEMAEETVKRFMESYDDDHSYSWVMDIDGVVAGTIGAYDFKESRIEVGFSVVPGWQGRGFATEALTAVLKYLTDNEGIPVVTAWCAVENAASHRVLEKSGMKLVSTEKNGLRIGNSVYDKLIFEYRKKDTGKREEMSAWEKLCLK